MKVVGIDGAILNFGIAMGNFNPVSKELIITEIIHLAYKRPKNSKSLADANQAKKISQELRKCCIGAGLVASELPHGSQSAQAAWSLGSALGIIASLDYDIKWLTANQVKKHTGNYSKREMIDWAVGLYPELNWKYYRGRVQNDQEHSADAIAILHTALGI